MAGENEIIDATQNAVLNAADSVVNALEVTAQELGGHAVEPFYQSAEFCVAVSFVLVFFGLMRPICRLGRKMLRKRANLIGKRIEDASNLKEEAQKLLADYERKSRRAKQEAQEILSRSEREINLIRKEQLAKLDKVMEVKKRDAKARIKSVQDAAAKEIADNVAQLTVASVKNVLSQKLDAKAQAKLVDESIERLAAGEF